MSRLLSHARESDLWEVLLAVRARLAGVEPARHQLVVVALAACFDDTGKVSRGAYFAWRRDQPRPDEWPSVKEIEAVCGSWIGATSQLGKSVCTPITVRRKKSVGPATEADGLVECVTEYARLNPRASLVFDAYRAWARDQMRRPDRLRDRYFLSMGPVTKHHGTWRALLERAGLWERRLAESARGVTKTASLSREEQREVAIGLLLDAAPDDGRYLTKQLFRDYVAEREREAAAAGEALRLPRDSWICSLFDSWPDANAAAGLISATEADQRRGHRGYFHTDEELVDGLVEHRVRTGRAPRSEWQYDKWRLDEPKGATPLPAALTISDRLGWEEANRLADVAVAERSADAPAGAVVPLRDVGASADLGEAA